MDELYEVEKIVDKRKNNKGKTEYLVRWRGYGNDDDTWEPETHLSSCMVFIHDFDRLQRERQRDGTFLRSTRRPPSAARGQGAGNNARMQISPSLPHGGGKSDNSNSLTEDQTQTNLDNPPPANPANVPSAKQPHQVPSLDKGGVDPKKNSQQPLMNERFEPCNVGAAVSNAGLITGSAVSTGRRSVDLTKTGIKILVPKSPMNTRTDSEESPSEAAHSLEQGGQEPEQVPPEVALLEKPPGVQLRAGEERARMGTRPSALSQSTVPSPQVPLTPATMRTLNGTGTSKLMQALASNGVGRPQSAFGGVSSASGVAGKRRLEERSAFDKRLRFSVRQTESAYRYRDIVVKKQDGFTHILLSTKTSENNSLNPDVMKEIQSAMATAASDDSKVVLLSAVGSVFCYGLDFIYFISRLTDDRKKESIKMAETVRTFVNTFIQFKKPVVVAVNGPAVGLGAAILPLCDVVWANEKAWFQTPYTIYGQTPDACSSFTFPRIMGVASANEMLLSGRKLTAQEACAKGLVSQVLWPGTFTQEVMLRVRELVSCNSVVLRESKALMRNTNRAALEQANERECEALKRVWGSSQGTDSILKYLYNRLVTGDSRRGIR